jgi:O-antigen ligase
MVAVVLLFQGNPHTLLTNGPNVTSTFKKSGQLSAYLIGSLPIIWFNLRHRSPTRSMRARRRILIAATMVAIVATGSRTGFLVGGMLVFTLFAGPTLLAFLRGRTALKLTSLAFGLMLLVPIFRLVQGSLPFSFQRAASIVTMADDEDGAGSLESLSQSRMYQMQGFAVAVSQHPWTGVGVGDFYTHNTALVPGAWKPHEIHNTYLGVWAETGIVGAIGLFLFLFGITQASWQTIAHGKDGLSILGVALMLSVLTFYVYSFSHFGLRMRHMWGLFGVVLALWNVTQHELARARTSVA